MDHLTTGRYLELTEIAYDSFFEDARSMTVVEKHQRWADSRHGGMLDLGANDAEGFRAWFLGRSWEGTHPFEIVFGHPHGIHLWPRHHESAGTWTFLLAAGAEGYFAMGVTMARALLEESIPVELADADQVLTSLRGEDEVAVGPHLHMLSLADLEEYRPSAVAHIRWDSIPEIRPIAVEQAQRVAQACGKDT